MSPKLSLMRISLSALLSITLFSVAIGQKKDLKNEKGVSEIPDLQQQKVAVTDKFYKLVIKEYTLKNYTKDEVITYTSLEPVVTVFKTYQYHFTLVVADNAGIKSFIVKPAIKSATGFETFFITKAFTSLFAEIYPGQTKTEVDMNFPFKVPVDTKYNSTIVFTVLIENLKGEKAAHKIVFKIGQIPAGG